MRKFEKLIKQNKKIPYKYIYDDDFLKYLKENIEDVNMERIIKYTPELLEDEDFLECVLKNINILLPSIEKRNKIVDNYDLMDSIVSETGSYFYLASDRLKNDDTFVNNAIRLDPLNVIYANPRFLKDIELVKKGLFELKKKNHINYFDYKYGKSKVFEIVDKLLTFYKDDKKLINDLIVFDIDMCEILYNYWKNDLQLCKYVIKKKPIFFYKIDKQIALNDKDILLSVLSSNECNEFDIEMIKKVRKDLLNDKEIGILLVKNNKIAYNYLSNNLKNDIDIKSLSGIIDANNINENENSRVNASSLDYLFKLKSILENEEKTKQLLYQKLNTLEIENKSLKEENNSLKEKHISLEEENKSLNLENQRLRQLNDGNVLIEQLDSNDISRKRLRGEN